MAPRVLTVAQDGRADFATVQEAIDCVPLSNTSRTVIRVSPGIYRQPVYVPKTKNFITIAGLSPETTLLTWNNTASAIQHHQVPNLTNILPCDSISLECPNLFAMFMQVARVIGTGTFGCATVIVEGEDFIAENVTFENSSPQVYFKTCIVTLSACIHFPFFSYLSWVCTS